jgi:hypothetical protein
MQIEIKPSRTYQILVLSLNLIVIIASFLLNNIYLAVLLSLVASIYSWHLIKTRINHTLILNKEQKLLDNQIISDLKIISDNSLYLFLSYQILGKNNKIVIWRDSVKSADIYELRRKLYV